MDININQITPRREGNEITSINVHFTARTDDINLNGSVPVSVDSVDFEAIENEVKQELVEKIIGGETEAE